MATKEDRRVRRMSVGGAASQQMMQVEGGEEQPAQPLPSTVAVKNDMGRKWLQLTGHQGEVFMCVWNPVSRQLASGSADGMCRLWGLTDIDAAKINATTGDNTEIAIRSSILAHSQFPCERFKDVTSVTWSPDGQFLATGCYDGMARIWDSQGNLVKELKEHSGPVFSLKWNKAGNYILSGSYDRRAIVWDATTGQPVKSFMLHAAPVLDVDWKDSDSFATCSSDMCIFICRVSSAGTGAEKTLKGHTDEVNAVCWSPGGALLASCSDDSTAKIWSAADGLKLDLVGHTKEIYTVRWTLTGPGSNHPDKPLYLCTASFDGTVKAWDASTGAVVHNLKRHMQPVYSIAPSPGGLTLATGSLGGFVCVWNMQDGSLVRFLPSPLPPFSGFFLLLSSSHPTFFLFPRPFPFPRADQGDEGQRRHVRCVLVCRRINAV